MYLRQAMGLNLVLAMVLAVGCGGGEQGTADPPPPPPPPGGPTVGVLLFREDGYAGAPVANLEQWRNAPLAVNFGKLYDDEAVKKVLKTKLAAFQVEILSEHKRTVHETLEQHPEFAGLIVLYLNAGSLTVRMVQPGQYLTDNMLVRRQNGEHEAISRKEHLDYGHAAPTWATGTYYTNYYGAECCFFLPGSNQPDAHSLVVEQDQTPARGQPNFTRLLESVLDKAAPQIKAALPRSSANPPKGHNDRKPPVPPNEDKRVEKESDTDNFQGSWRVLSWADKGKPLPEDQVTKIVYVFSKANVTCVALEGKVLKGTFKVEPTADPKKIDLDFKEISMSGVYTFIDKDHLLLNLSVFGSQQVLRLEREK